MSAMTFSPAWAHASDPRSASQHCPEVFGTSNARTTWTIRNPKITAMPSEVEHARGLEAAQQRYQAGELHRLPDRQPGHDLGDTGQDHDDVKQLLDGIVRRDVFMRDFEVERIARQSV